MPNKNKYSYWWDFGPNYETIRVCSDDPDFWIVKEFKIVNNNSELLVDKAQKMIHDLKCGRISHNTLKKIKNNN